ncbi:hypothetical protein [Rhizobium sp. BK176]|uniref:hypothetical protein n=1 Tax=Rhizobium sp. BK176 TaxID=2587071 RepID=UPI00216825EA|nr:hypothetical protein [Rhizobium sp. BK176]MCS4088695.1 hypothetical protein [Rhizobium sp. BK176]
MKKRDIPTLSTEEILFDLNASFWTPPSTDVIRTDLEEFRRQFGLMPELAEALGVRQFLREDTLRSVN